MIFRSNGSEIRRSADDYRDSYTHRGPLGCFQRTSFQMNAPRYFLRVSLIQARQFSDGSLCQHSCLSMLCLKTSECKKEAMGGCDGVAVCVFQGLCGCMTSWDREVRGDMAKVSDRRTWINKQMNRWIQRQWGRKIGWVMWKRLVRPLLRDFCFPPSSTKAVEKLGFMHNWLTNCSADSLESFRKEYSIYGAISPSFPNSFFLLSPAQPSFRPCSTFTTRPPCAIIWSSLVHFTHSHCWLQFFITLSVCFHGHKSIN